MQMRCKVPALWLLLENKKRQTRLRTSLQRLFFFFFFLHDASCRNEKISDGCEIRTKSQQRQRDQQIHMPSGISYEYGHTREILQPQNPQSDHCMAASVRGPTGGSERRRTAGDLGVCVCVRVRARVCVLSQDNNSHFLHRLLPFLRRVQRRVRQHGGLGSEAKLGQSLRGERLKSASCVDMNGSGPARDDSHPRKEENKSSRAGKKEKKKK